ncbi:ATPase [Psychrobacter sp. I-STPA10]|uniref:ATPase n=1 Tax=Psychrobacter sp. I-STPA10 TaxID=2585769 RepID=UPI001E3E5C56|nr:ATPase [Psychrobacter sp. I-STPA10]
MAKKHNRDSSDNHNSQDKPEDFSNPNLASLDIHTDPLSQFRLDDDALRLALIKAQYALRQTRLEGQPTSLLILVNGMEMSAKGSAVTQLRQWVDPRLLKVEASISQFPSPSEPVWQPHVSQLPRHGNVLTYFSNWYADLIYTVLAAMGSAEYNNNCGTKKTGKKNKKTTLPNHLPSKNDWEDYLIQQLNKLQAFEADLANNHTKILKCWFHIDENTLNERLNDDIADPTWLYHLDWRDKKALADFNKVARTLLRTQEDWIIIDGTDSKAAERQFAHEVLQAMQQAIVNSQSPEADGTTISNNHYQQQFKTFEWADIPDELVDITDPDMDKEDYKNQLEKKQQTLASLLRSRSDSANDQRHVVFVFEGMDAAGKGGAIKRLVSALDPREYQIYNIAAPTDIELQHPYLWRFWTRLPKDNDHRLSRVAIFDRSWYGRVLVERVEGFASNPAWQRAYEEIVRFEQDLCDSGYIVIKYWLAIDKKEQLKRFDARQNTPHKQFKITEDDWRNRDKWSQYVQAASDMLSRTHSKRAPWHVVATNDKRTARLEVLEHAITQLRRELS